MYLGQQILVQPSELPAYLQDSYIPPYGGNTGIVPPDLINDTLLIDEYHPPALPIDAYLLSAPSENQTPTNTTPLGQTAGQIGNAVGNAGGTVLGNLLNGLVEGLGNGVQQTVGATGATVVDSTLSAWFKTNWWKVLLGVVAFFGLLYFVIKKAKR